MNSVGYSNFVGIGTRTQEQVEFNILLPIFLLSFFSCCYVFLLVCKKNYRPIFNDYHSQMVLILFFFDGMLNFFNL